MIFEVELKYALANRDELLEKLKSFQARRVGIVSQKDIYFNHPSRDFAQTDEAVRIRLTDDKTILTYKGPKLDSATKTRKELEISLAAENSNHRDIEDFLLATGFRKVRSVEKNRECWTLTWEKHSVDLAIDDVKDLGLFLEIEMQAKEASLESTRHSLLQLATALKLNDPIMQSYLELLLEC